jgi:nitrate/TMAO reductase-like tetraheme cytochrome c subunit
MVIALQQAQVARDSLQPDSIVVASPLPGGPAAVARFLFNAVPQWLQIAGVFVGAVVAVALLVFIWRRRRSMLARLGATSRAWKLGFAAIVLVMLGGIGAAGMKTWNFMMHDNGFCTGCHVMKTPFERFSSSEHSKLLCHDCHRQGMVANVRQLYQWVSERPEKIGPHAPVPNPVCNECHVQRDADSAWKRISATAGHQVHLNPRSPAFNALSCVSCHGKEIHRFKATEVSCAQSGCHDQVKIELGKMAGQSSLHCLVCHQFSAVAVEANPVDSARAALVPAQKQCLSCHQMQQRMKSASFDPAKDPHKGGCGLCHNPHTQTTTFGAYQSCATSRCHANADTLTTMHRGLGDHTLQNCGACHVAHTWKVKATNCRGCHQDTDLDKLRTRRGARRISLAPLQPPGAGAPGWPTLPNEESRGASPIVLVPVSWGTQRQVVAAGTPRIAGRSRRRGSGRLIALDPALSFHAVVQAVPAARPQATTRFSHRLHRTLECATCHGTATSHGALKPGIATGCASCHHADNATGRACERCHVSAQLSVPRSIVATMQLSVSTAPRNRSLVFAHTRHAKLACANCHAQDLTRTVQTTCSSCHADHHEATRTCASCHPSPLATHSRALHVTGCGGAGCHARESTPATTPVRSVCVACHAQQASHKPGRDCATCHLTRWQLVSAAEPSRRSAQ